VSAASPATRPTIRSAARWALGPALLSLACAAAACALAVHHPLSPPLALAAVVGLAALAAWQPLLIPVGLLGLLPVAGLAPWTGWMLVEEYDLLLLALLAGGWGRLAWPRGLPARVAAAGSATGLWWLLVLLYAGAVAVSAWHGLVDADAWAGGRFAWGWWQGWREPMNVLRIAKPLAGALLAWPLWQALQARWPDAAPRAAGWGAWLGLAVVSVLCTWERWAWPGLTDFSTDYRTTALFWETHVGGAALDGFLALALPFGFWALANARRRGEAALALAVLALAGYAVLTTFSRGLYLGVLLGAGLWWLRTPRPPGGGRFAAAAAGWVGVFALAAALAFPAGGWRALGALWGLVALLFLLWQRAAVGPAGPPRRTVAWVAAGGAAGAGLTAAALGLPAALKAPYVLYGLLAAATALLWLWPAARGRATGAATWAAASAAAVGVALHWGETAARWQMAAAVAMVLLAAAAGVARPAWRGPPGGRWRASALAAMGLAGVVVGSFGGGHYLEGRLASTENDWEGRMHHWSRALSLPQGPMEALFGIGVGRFAARFAFSGEASDQTGDYRWLPQPGGGGAVVLTGGKHLMGFGQLFRLSQRVAVPVGPVQLRWRIHTEMPIRLQLEFCNKHLIYEVGCRVLEVPMGGTRDKPAPPGWVEGQITAQAMPPWQAPVFSVGVDSRGGRVVIDRLEATDARGRALLVNSGFDQGLAHWLPSSDRHHLPWHAKNLGLHLLIEQGWLGLAGFAALVVFAVARLLSPGLRGQPLAAPLLAGLVGFLAVGLFDSLLDVPRVAFACLWCLGIAATLRAGPLPQPAAGPAPQRAIRGNP